MGARSRWILLWNKSLLVEVGDGTTEAPAEDLLVTVFVLVLDVLGGVQVGQDGVNVVVELLQLPNFNIGFQSLLTTRIHLIAFGMILFWCSHSLKKLIGSPHAIEAMAAACLN